MSECVINVNGEANAFPFSDTCCRIDSSTVVTSTLTRLNVFLKYSPITWATSDFSVCQG